MRPGLFERHNSHCKYSGKLFVSLLFPVYSRLEPFHGLPSAFAFLLTFRVSQISRYLKSLYNLEVDRVFYFHYYYLLSFSQNCVWLKNELAFNYAF